MTDPNYVRVCHPFPGGAVDLVVRSDEPLSPAAYAAVAELVTAVQTFVTSQNLTPEPSDD